MSIFPERPDRARLAVFARHEFPRADGATLYASLDRLTATLGIDYQVFHSLVPDPGALDPALRPRLGAGVFAPLYPELHANDLAHCQATLPMQCSELVATMAKWSPTGAAGLLQRREVREAFSSARLARAWHADAVLSWGLDEGALHAFVVASLLELPHLVVLPAAHGAHEYGQLLPMYADRAHTVVAVGDGVVAHLAARPGAAGPRRVVEAPGGDLAAAPVRQALAAALAQPRREGAPRRGPWAAFTRMPRPPAADLPARRFVVLGTERTGSNMLVGMLEARPGVTCAGEVFNARSCEEGQVFWLPATDWRDAGLLRLRRDDPGALLARLAREGHAAGARWVGCKLLYLQAEADDRIVDAMAGDPELRVVHLLRAGRLQRWLSLVRARASDAWFAAAGAALSRDEAPIELDPVATASEFVLCAQQEDRFRALFRRHQQLELDYDDLVQRLPVVARRLGALLGVDLGALVPKSRKTGPDDVAGAIANFAALRSAFAGTRWADQFG